MGCMKKRKRAEARRKTELHKRRAKEASMHERRNKN
jgi:hypothetical protein